MSFEQTTPLKRYDASDIMHSLDGNPLTHRANGSWVNFEHLEAMCQDGSPLVTDLIREVDRAVKQAGGTKQYDTLLSFILRKHLAAPSKSAPDGWQTIDTAPMSNDDIVCGGYFDDGAWRMTVCQTVDRSDRRGVFHRNGPTWVTHWFPAASAQPRATKKTILPGDGDRWPKMGERLRFTGRHGYDHDRAEAARLMKVGDIVTVRDIDIGRDRHTIEFDEFPGLRFNGVMFEFVE